MREKVIYFLSTFKSAIGGESYDECELWCDDLGSAGQMGGERCGKKVKTKTEEKRIKSQI